MQPHRPEQRILIATDLSTAADEAIRQGHARARATGAQLAVCHVLPNLLRGHPLFPHLGTINALDVPATRDQVTQLIVDRVIALTDRRPDAFEVLLDEGTPHAVIVQQAETWKADLVVVGSHGATGLARVLLGSVAERVVRHAHAPVLVARPISKSGEVLVGTDFSDPNLPAVAAAAWEAKREQRRLTILHSIEIPTMASMSSYLSVPFGGIAYGGLDAEAMASLETMIDGRLRDVLAEADATEGARTVVWGPPGAALIHAAERLNAELVVVATLGRTGLRRLLVGSVAETVVRAAPCSVLVVRLAA